MLDLLRRKAQSPYIQMTILVVIIVFVFWGVGTNRSSGPNTVATVNDEPITYQEYQKAFDQTVDRYREQFGGTIPRGLLESLGIREQVLNQLVQQALLQQAAGKTGLLVSNQEVQDTIREMESFRQDGIFNLQRYRDILAASRLTTDDFESNIRADILDRKIIRFLSSFAKTTEEELRERFSHEYDRIKVDYVSFAAEDFRDKVTVLDQELEAFYEEQKSKYQTDPQLKLKYITFPFAPSGESSFSQEEIARYYQQNLGKYAIPEQRWARHILIKTVPEDSSDQLAAKRDKLLNILEIAKAGGNFDELAKQYSEDASTAVQGGNLGFFSRGQMVKPFEDAAFTLQKGEVSNIVQTQYGFHIIKVEDIKAGKVTSLAEAEADIKKSLAAEQGKKLAFERATKSYEDIILAGSLEKYAGTAEVPLEETDFFTRKNPPAKLAGKNDLLASAFSLKDGELSSIIESAEMYAILYVAEVREPQQQPLAEVRAQVEKEFIADKAAKMARESAETLLNQAKSGADLGESAREAGQDVETTDFYTRNAPSADGLPGDLARKGFELSARAPYPDEVLSRGQNFYVLHYQEKKPAPEELFAEKRDELASMLLMEKQLKVVGSWVKYMEAKADITTNEKFFQ